MKTPGRLQKERPGKRRQEDSQMTKVCACGSTRGACVECGEVYALGAFMKCPRPYCQGSQCPVACAKCALDISENNDGVIDHKGNLIPWRST